MKKKNQEKQKKSSILRFYPFTKGLRGKFLLAMATLILSSLASYMTPQVIRVTVDSVVNQEPFALPAGLVAWLESMGGREMLRGHIYICALAALAFAAIAGGANYLSRMGLAKACEGTVERLRNRLFGHIQHLPYAWHNSHQTGDIIQRCTQDVELIRVFVNDQLTTVVRTVLSILISLGLMFMMNVQLSLIVLAFIPVVIGYSMIFFVLVGKKFEQADRTDGELTALVQENLTGVRVVRAFGRERFEIDRFCKKKPGICGPLVPPGGNTGRGLGHWRAVRRPAGPGNYGGRRVLCGKRGYYGRGIFGLYRLQLYAGLASGPAGPGA